MKVFLKLDGAHIMGHASNLHGDYNTEVDIPDDFFDTNLMTYTYKYINNKFVKLTNTEKMYHPLKLLNEWSIIRAQRNKKINDIIWIFQRHEREKYLNISTTLNEEQIQLCHQYVRDLTMIPQVYSDPYCIVWPTLPSCATD